MTTERTTYRAGLTRDAVVEAAVTMLQQEGADAFSVRRLATGLGVDTMALYKHVRNKDDLLGGALAQVFRRARPTGEGLWWEQARDTFGEHRRVIREQPWVLSVMFNHKVRSSEPWAGVDQTLALLQEHLGAEPGARWMRLLTAFTNGFLLTEADLLDVPDTSEVELMHPRVMAAFDRGTRSGDADFTHGLDALITTMRGEAGA